MFLLFVISLDIMSFVTKLGNLSAYLTADCYTSFRLFLWHGGKKVDFRPSFKLYFVSYKMSEKCSLNQVTGPQVHHWFQIHNAGFFECGGRFEGAVLWENQYGILCFWLPVPKGRLSVTFGLVWSETQWFSWSFTLLFYF